MAEMKVYQREHFQRKIRDLLQPEIEKEEMLMSSTIADMVDSAEEGLARKIGADIIIEDLEKARRSLSKAESKARTFLDELLIRECRGKKLLVVIIGQIVIVLHQRNVINR